MDGKILQLFSFPYFIMENGSGSGGGITENITKTGYTGYRNGRELKNLTELIIV